MRLLQQRRIYRGMKFLVAVAMIMSLVPCNGDDHKSSTVTSSSPAARVAIGRHVYAEPFTSYPSSVTEVLLRFSKILPNDDIARAEWYLDLALAHRQVAEERFARGSSVDVDDEQENNWDLATNAVQMAIQIYQGMKNQDSNEEAILLIDHHLASDYCLLGEIQSLSDDGFQSGIDYLRRGEALFRDILQQKSTDSATIQVIERDLAVCCLHLGASLVRRYDQLQLRANNLLQKQQQTVLANSMADGMPDSTFDLLTSVKTWMAEDRKGAIQMVSAFSESFKLLDQAEAYFVETTQILQRSEHSEMGSDKRELIPSLSSALKQLGAVWTHRQKVREAVKFFEQAVSIEETELLPLLAPDSTEATGTIASIGDSFYSLADLHLQLKNFGPSNEYYSRAMQRYEQVRGLSDPPPQISSLSDTGEVQELLAMYEKALEDYHETLQAQTVDIVDHMMGGDEYYYDKDDGYEGDLHSNIGSLYLTKGDLLLAESHLEQAVRLYQMNGEASGQSIGEAHYNLAIVLFARNEYVASATERQAALEIFQKYEGTKENLFDANAFSIDQEMVREMERIISDFDTTSVENTVAEGLSATIVKDGTYETFVDLEGLREARLNSTEETIELLSSSRL